MDPELLTVEAVVMDAVCAIQVTDRGGISTVLPPGRYYAGDISHVMAPLDYQRLITQGAPRAFTLRGLRGVYGYAARYTGQCVASNGHLHGVETGVIGVLPLLLMGRSPGVWYGEGPFADGSMLNCAEDVVIVIQEGVMTVAVGNDRRITVDTRLPEAEEPHYPPTPPPPPPTVPCSADEEQEDNEEEEEEEDEDEVPRPLKRSR